MAVNKLLDEIRRTLHPWDKTDNIAPLLDLVGDARVVLIGESTHGTQDFYETRAEITKRLIQEKGFTGVAVEADWPDAYRVNSYVRGRGDDNNAGQALGDFTRFPRWMWRNTATASFIEWLREWNDTRQNDNHQAGFYGLDLYSLYSSIDAVINYLETIDPEAAQRARARYGCFQQFGENPQDYGYAATYGITQSCENEAVQQLVELQKRAAEYMGRNGRVPEDAYFYAEQNARLAKNAEKYYRSMFQGRYQSWNLRDSHMAETLDALLDHLVVHQERGKVVVWAHNSHLGDARATEMSRRGEHNLGQLARENYGNDCVNIGFSTYTGTVTAASDWGGAAERKYVRPGLADSYEQLLHQVGIPNFTLDLTDAPQGLHEQRIQRAIGVIYRPQTERMSHYFYCRLHQQFNALIHFDRTEALEPLEASDLWKHGEEVPETYPFGE